MDVYWKVNSVDRTDAVVQEVGERNAEVRKPTGNVSLEEVFLGRYTISHEIMGYWHDKTGLIYL